MPPPRISFHPPLLNSACPWATTSEDLRALLHSPSTGAITVRTSVLPTKGFNHQPARHRYVFFDVGSGRAHSRGSADGPVPAEFWAGTTTMDDLATASLNSLGYSPFPLSTYLDILASLSCELPHVKKTVIVSVTGSPDEVRGCYDMIVRRRREDAIHFPLAVEINLSCPNITNAPPPAYDMRRLEEYLAALPSDTDEDVDSGSSIPVGIKTPPYTYEGQFRALALALRTGAGAGKVSFVTATNTLGSCLVLDGAKNGAARPRPVLPGLGEGGMAGPPLQPLALGNVAALRRALDADETTARIDVIGVGGVGDAAGYRRMQAAGASAVAVGTALGRRGVGVFDEIAAGLRGNWYTDSSNL